MLSVRITPQTHIFDLVARVNHLIRNYAFHDSDKQCIFISVSEVVQNVQIHADGLGVFRYGMGDRGFELECTDYGHGIAHLDDVLHGSYESLTGLGMGIASVQRLMDVFQITTSSEGTTIVAAKRERRQG